MVEEKFWYNVSLTAEGVSTGWIQLTRNEAKAVAYATSMSNWKNVYSEAWCGGFSINLNSESTHLPESVCPYD